MAHKTIALTNELREPRRCRRGATHEHEARGDATWKQGGTILKISESQRTNLARSIARRR